MQIDISIIIVLYKSEITLLPCTESLRKSLNLIHKRVEFIFIVNDKNNKSYHFPKNSIVFIPEKNLGFAGGVNLGFKHARGKWLLLVNPDTITDINALHYLFKHTVNKEVVIIGPKIYQADGSIQLTINSFPSILTIFLEQTYLYKLWPFKFLLPKSNPNSYKYSHFVPALEGTYLLINKSVYSLLGGFDSSFFMYFEDLDFCKRIRDLGLKILFEPEAEIIHLRSQSTAGIMVAKQFVNSFRIFMRKYYPIIYVLIALELFYLGSLFRQKYWYLKSKIHKNNVDIQKALKMSNYYLQIQNQIKKIKYI